MLRSKINKADYDKLDKAIQIEYKQDGSADAYLLDVDADSDIGELRRAKTRETELRTAAETQVTNLTKKVSDLTEELQQDPRKRNDVKLLEQSWQKKLDDAVADEKVKTTAAEGKATATSKQLTSSLTTSWQAGPVLVPCSLGAIGKQ